MKSFDKGNEPDVVRDFSVHPDEQRSANISRKIFDLCNAYGECDDSCIIFGCEFEENEDARNWTPDIED